MKNFTCSSLFIYLFFLKCMEKIYLLCRTIRATAKMRIYTNAKDTDF